MTIEKILKLTCQKISAIEADILLSFVLKKDRVFLYQNPDYEISTKNRRQFTRLVAKRMAGEPIAYITRHQEFYGLDFYVNKNVLIPRPETELLVEEVLKKIQISNIKYQKIADVGTGSGNIAITLAKKLLVHRSFSEDGKIFAIDISKEALKVARKNATKHRVTDKIQFLHGSLLEPLKIRHGRNRKIDIICANLPYVRTDQKVSQSEPSNSLYSGKEGLDLIIKLIKQTPEYLNKSGTIFLEISPEQKNKLSRIIPRILPDAKFEFKKDLAKKDRIVIINLT